MKELLKVFDIIPDDALDREATLVAREWINGIRGKSEIRRRAKRLMKEGGGGDVDEVGRQGGPH